MTGFSFGATAAPATATTSLFSFGATKTTVATSSTTSATSSTGFNLGLQKTTASTGLLATPASTSTAGFGSFGLTPATSTSAGFSLGAPSTLTSASSTGLGGFSFGKAATTTATPSFGVLGTAPTPTSSTGFNLGLGGLFGASAGTTTTTSSIFTSQPVTASTFGLGGVDPNTAFKSGTSASSGAASDGKTLKESILPEPLTETVDSLQKYVKEEKAVRETLTGMSAKPLIKVQEDMTALRQLLSVVANGLQRNACSVEKLKQEMSQKLKTAEMAQRTKDIPPGLQYENSAPTEYFQGLVEEFEERMAMYRQQIETLDNHLAALHQPSAHTPSEILSLLKKLHETFLSLAAQLQQVHEAVKSQKDQFLTYRRVFHGDTKNIFHKPAPALKSTKKTQLSDLAGPNPFPGTTNAAAQAMAMVHTRAQQPQGPPITGLVGGSHAGFGSSSYGGAIFGTAKTSTGFGATVASSIGGAGNLFSSTALVSSPASGGLGTLPTLGLSTTAALNLAESNLNLSANTKQPFQLQKPPQGAKRNKR